MSESTGGLSAEQVQELYEDMTAAVINLRSMAAMAVEPDDEVRLRAKAAGVALVMGYLDRLVRLNMVGA